MPLPKVAAVFSTMSVGVMKAIDGLALLYAVLYFPVPLYWLVLHPAIDFWRRVGYRSFWVALPIWILSAVPLLWVHQILFAVRFPRVPLTYLSGGALLGLTFWVHRQVHSEFSFKKLAGVPELNPNHPLRGIVHSGIYARVRHPRYANLVLGFVAFGLLTGAVGIFLLAIITFMMYLIVAPLEERELRRQYASEYEAYARTVPRFLPRFWRATRKGPL